MVFNGFQWFSHVSNCFQLAFHGFSEEELVETCHYRESMNVKWVADIISKLLGDAPYVQRSERQMFSFPGHVSELLASDLIESRLLGVLL